jgi:3-oxoacyl-[acyl-carrier-protein] synthase III
MKSETHQDISIVGASNFSPGPMVGNQELEDALQAPICSLMGYFGVIGRHYVVNPRTGELLEPHLGTAEMSARAALKAINSAELEISDIDTLICGTSTPDERLPPLTHSVQRKLGLKDVAVYELHGGCSVSLQALSVASALIRSGQAKKVLVTLADTLSRHFLSPLLQGKITKVRTEDIINATTFADGAAAAIVQKTDENLKGFKLKLLNIHSCFTSLSHGFGVSDKGKTSHDHRAISDTLPLVVERGMAELLDACKKINCHIDRLIIPQANRSMVDMIKTSLHEKIFYVGDKTGNSPAPAILRALAIGIEKNELIVGKTQVGLLAVESASWTYGVSFVH